MTKLQGIILGVLMVLVGLFGCTLLYDSFTQSEALRFVSMIFGSLSTVGGLLVIIGYVGEGF